MPNFSTKLMIEKEFTDILKEKPKQLSQMNVCNSMHVVL